MNKTPFWLDPKPVTFPPTNLALDEPDGLLAIGGALTQEWLLQAYSKGIFPWFNPDEPILWWSPNPRSVLLIDDLKIRRSLRKSLRKMYESHQLKVTLDQSFIEVMQHCAQIERKDQAGTWITDDMLSAYNLLHQAGHAHSVEVWWQDELVGGLYGVTIGKMFFGESMFSKINDASKIALVALSMQLKAWGFSLIDTQVETAHLKSMGASMVSRQVFESLLQQQIQQSFPPHKWELEIDWFQAAIEHSHFQNALSDS
ncbi:MAG: leucyl/phenylalanyl-tRNA--protein transferase [Thiomicrorhabdus chilensis]|uniref:leucyl/phenylalanyl-tRNA--protein transferase n=1 Tax=Thiomicrorhabdus chilensis TaxID=63656 RepID=UPI00299E6752|nr:leucyl/phenylalanyl-tRNA--protein transferase [Thiomicrorhabdus chilensis]MDX1348342.1 leucyl/phenylalanyl-tRNA--protein transferase [Thiomicrorhabdus chilensis]